MKRFLFAALLLVAGSWLPARADDGAATIKLISYNLRNGRAQDGPNAWEKRRPATVRMLREEAPDLFGVQEAYLDQLQYIDSECPQYARVGVGRDDGAEEGETMAIYYLTSRFELLDSGTFWLSETPDEVSRGWDGACNRTATWVELRDRETGREFFYFNTHLDHMGEVAREEGIKLLVARIRALVGKSPVIAGGDFNTPVDSPIFKPLTRYMKSARAMAPKSDHKGTFNGFGSAPSSIVIDHLYFRGGLKCLEFRTLDGNYGVPYISDHYPIELVFAY
ncbi:MAG TPA: endonuclease/exonuclease/phosphatase family protein [Candidatus Alistipes intestinipullorum]|nr:endonuclease/exonuclease/phosphatase family protein [Candidatus Alistipes intestinipullorum]